jgi:hypothetical protein
MADTENPETQGYQFRSSQEMTVSAPEPFHKRPVVKHSIFYFFWFINFILLCVAVTPTTVWTKATLNGNSASYTLTTVTAMSATTTTTGSIAQFDQVAGTSSVKTAQATQGLVGFVLFLHLVQSGIYAFFYIRKKLDNIVTRLIQLGFVFGKFFFLAIAVGIFNNASGTLLAQAKAAGAMIKLSV